jgi:hypothetical protein
MAFGLTSCSACRWGIEPIIVRTEPHSLIVDGAIIAVHCE